MDLPQNTQYKSDYVSKLMPLVSAITAKGKQTSQPTQQTSLPRISGTPSSLSQFPITTPYGGSTNYEPGGTHGGIDIGTPTGTSLPAIQGGTVTDVVTGKGWTPKTPSYGNTITVKDNEGNLWRYSHLSDAYVKVGDTVNTGQAIGTSGYSGSTYSAKNPNSPGPHVDIRLLKNLSGRYVEENPQQYIR